MGDTLATGDVMTASGCNVAILTAIYFQEFLEKVEHSFDCDLLLTIYGVSMNAHIDHLHEESVRRRKYYAC